MSDIVIRVENLSKQYRIGASQKNRNFREAIKESLKEPFRRAQRLFRGSAPGLSESDQTIWALKDVSFEIRGGDLLGIIGRNGSGKSTLLKVLSRITEPTSGEVQIVGRIRSLLEVGTGFHPELTGRENIYLNGAILGMKKGEIRQKFDEIVAFAEVEKFIDTPIKRYSSGMYLRLAFAVAAHLESEILIVDEVLAVGDARFQRKCLNKMQEVGEQGRTVLFVSHSMPTITRLCKRAILLNEGKLIAEGPAHTIVRTYLSGSDDASAGERIWTNAQQMPGGEVARLCAVRIKTEDGKIANTVAINKSVEVEMEYDVLKPGYVLLPHFQLMNEEGVIVFKALDIDPAWRKRSRPAGHFVSKALIPGNLLQEGLHFVWVALITLEPLIVQFYEPDVVAFQIIESNDGESARGDYTGDISGTVRPLLKWTTVFSPARQPGTN
ncbi:MAG: ATP-binding cassette domain-containing protein [Syntrophorhabdus sp.]|jgi:lipopolysaccharide transport system ATP-binding protein|nr:ATP-binding cassette domain-containing protein [Syntrophorhabdus sp.]OPX95351.1 MAG: Teichoic acids export ATP-binding protein TagH [Syntrophorhabdus sp. PtaB.Bin027]